MSLAFLQLTTLLPLSSTSLAKRTTSLATNAVRQDRMLVPTCFEPTAAYAGTQASSAVQLYNYSMAAAGLTVEGGKVRGYEIRFRFHHRELPVLSLATTEPKPSLRLSGIHRLALSRVHSSSRHTMLPVSSKRCFVAIAAGMTIDNLQLLTFCSDKLYQPSQLHWLCCYGHLRKGQVLCT